MYTNCISSWISCWVFVSSKERELRLLILNSVYCSFWLFTEGLSDYWKEPLSNSFPNTSRLWYSDTSRIQKASVLVALILIFVTTVIHMNCSLLLTWLRTEMREKGTRNHGTVSPFIAHFSLPCLQSQYYSQPMDFCISMCQKQVAVPC